MVQLLAIDQAIKHFNQIGEKFHVDRMGEPV